MQQESDIIWVIAIEPGPEKRFMPVSQPFPAVAGFTHIEKPYLPMANGIDAGTGSHILKSASNGNTLVKRCRNERI